MRELLALLPALLGGGDWGSDGATGAGSTSANFLFHTDGLAVYRKVPGLVGGRAAHTAVNHSRKEWTSAVEADVGGVAVRVQGGTQLIDAFWRVQKRWVSLDHRSDGWGKIVKYLAEAWQYRHAEDIGGAWARAVARVGALLLSGEDQVMGALKAEARRRRVVLFQADIDALGVDDEAARLTRRASAPTA